MSRAYAFACSLALPLWAACAIGSPLVDDEDGPLGIGALMCTAPPTCEPRAFQVSSLPPQTPLDLEHCVGHALCAPVWAASDESTPGEASPSCASEPVDSLPLAAECTKQSLHVPEGVSELSYEQAHWTNFDLSIESPTPLMITLRAPELRAVAVHLKGPVVLSLEDAQPLDLRVFGQATAAGEPRLSLSNIQVQQFRVGDSAHVFQGTVVVRASKLNVIELHAIELDLESSRLEEGLVHAQGLSAADASFVKLDVQTQHGLFSEFETQECRLQLCEYASLIGGRINRSILEACPGTRVRVYATIVASSAVDGAIEADDSNFENTLFGAAQSTKLISYQSNFSSAALCGQLELLALDSTSVIKCSACEPSFLTAPHACEFPSPPDAPNPVHANFCEALSRGHHLPLCSPDLPARTRMR